MGRKKNLLTKEWYRDLWINRLTNLTANIFKWSNMPTEINLSAMEKQLMLGGFSIFFKDKELDKYFCLPGALTGVDVYGYPTKAQPISKGQINYQFPEYKVGEECVLIYANKTRTSALMYIEEFADKLSDVDIAIKMNTMAMKHPLLFKSNEQSKESFETMARQYEDNYYMLFCDKGMALDGGLETIDFKVSSNEILNLQKQKETILNEFFGLFGISGVVEKRERMIAGEMNSMMQQVGINRNMWMSTRKDAVKDINRIFGLNIAVDVNEVNFESNLESDKDKEDKNNEM